jgi:iron(III) transport system substrate-binding protein
MRGGAKREEENMTFGVLGRACRNVGMAGSGVALAAATLIGLGLTVPALADADQALVDAATKEGTVVWYTSNTEKTVVAPMAAAFEKKYPGIKVQTVIGLQGDLLLKLINEGSAGGPQADVFQGTSVVGPLKQANLLEPYKPAAAANFPEGFEDPDGYWTAEATLFAGATINTDLVPAADEPKTYEDLLDPKWKGKIAWITQESSGGPPGLIGTVLQSMGQDKGMDYLKKLADQQISNVPSNQRALTDQVIAGQYPLALTTFTHHAVASAAKGAPVKWLKIEPLTGILDVTMLLKGRPHPDAGKLLIEFILSPEGQAVFQEASSIPANPAVPGQHPELKPDTGGFKAVLLTPTLIDANFDNWVSIYHQLFK